MGFIWRAKHGLNKSMFLKTKIGLKLEGTHREEKEKGEKKKKGRRRREEEKEWRSSQASQRYGN